MTTLSASGSQPSKSKGRLAKPKCRNPFTGRFESKQTDPSSFSSDEFTNQPNLSLSRPCDSRKPNLRSRNAREISNESLSKAEIDRNSVGKMNRKNTRSKNNSKKNEKEYSRQLSNFLESDTTNRASKIQRVDTRNSKENVNSKRKLYRIEDTMTESDRISKKMISVDEKSQSPKVIALEMKDEPEQLKLVLCSAENVEQTTDNTQASENQEDSSELDIKIVCNIKICETCRKDIPFREIEIGHTKQCVKCLREEIFTFHSKYPKESEDEICDETKNSDPETILPKFMSVSEEDQIQIGPDHQALSLA